MPASRDRWLRCVVVLLLLMNVALLVERLGGGAAWTPAAMAQVSDTGAQFQQQIEQLKRANESLERIARQLENGPVPVRIVKEKQGAATKEGA